MKKVLLILLIILSPLPLMGQSTTVSGQVIDAGGQSWNNGTYSFQFVSPQSNFTTPPTWSGGAFNPNTPLTGALNGSGAYSQSVPSNTAITPSLSQWRLQVCSGTVPNKCTTVIQTITGATQTVNVTPPTISMEVTPNTAAYLDSEILGPVEGTTYFNVISGTQRTYHNGVWQTSSGGSGTVNSGTKCFPAVYTVTAAQVGPTSTICDASVFAGAHWTDKLVAAYTALGGGGGTIIIPDSIADDGSATTPSIPSNVTLRFPGNAAFIFCQVNVRGYTKIYMNGAVLRMNGGGSGCNGINADLGGTQQVYPPADTFVLDGVRVDCNAQTNSIGILITDGSNVLFEHTHTRGCTTGTELLGTQFGDFYYVEASENTVGLKVYSRFGASAGGGNQNNFYGPRFRNNSVGVIIANQNTPSTGCTTCAQGENFFFDGTWLSNTVADLATFSSIGTTDTHLIGGAPELTGSGAATITVDGNVVKKASIYQNHSKVFLDRFAINVGTLNPAILLETNSHAIINNWMGGDGFFFGLLAGPDATSTVSLSGAYGGLGYGSTQNVSSYPDYLTDTFFGAFAGLPISTLTNDITNAYTGNALVPPCSSATGTSSTGTAIDTQYGQVATVTYAASGGSDASNRCVFANWASSPLASGHDAIASFLMKSSTTESFKVAGVTNIPGFAGSSVSPASNLNLVAGQWTRVVSYISNVLNNSGMIMEVFPIGSSGPVVSFTRVESAECVTGNPNCKMLFSRILKTGAVNPNVPITASISYGSDTGAADASVVNTYQAPTSLSTGLEIDYLPTAANSTTTPTLNFNGTGAKVVTKNGAGALVANDLTTTAIAKVVYDGTEWQLQNPQSLVVGANTTLSNLGTTALNASLTPNTDNSIALGSSSKRWTNLFATALNCGIAGTTSCVLSGNGSTSGTATFTWPAVAGTSTNAITSSNVLLGPVGSGTSPTFQVEAGTGMYQNGAGQMGFALQGTAKFRLVSIFAVLPSTSVLEFNNNADPFAGAVDTGISRDAAGVIDIGTSAAGSTNGRLKAAGYISAGTKFTASGCSNTTTVGGATAGHFTSGTTGTCTVTITMGDSATAPNAWGCDAHDTTTPADVISQTSTLSTTQCTISGTTVSGDVIVFTATGH